jgi:hypothetical protein
MRLSDNFFKSGRLLTIAFLFFTPLLFGVENYVVENENIINERAVVKINEMGDELFNKDNISVYVFAKKSLGNASAKEQIDAITSALKTPYVLLLMFSEDKVIDIVSSKEAEGKFDKTQILSPVPYYGTIRPLLVAKKDFDSFSAAILNGYADIVEQIAKNDGAQLKSAIGNANKETLQYIRIVVYGLFVIVFFIYIYKRIKYRHVKKR